MIFYTFHKEQFNQYFRSQPFFEDKYACALNTDSHDIAHALDTLRHWIHVHKVEVHIEDLMIFDNQSGDDHLYFEDLIGEKEKEFFKDLKIGNWSWRLFQLNAIQLRMREAGFVGYWSKINMQRMLTLIPSDKMEVEILQSYCYQDLIDEYKKNNFEGGQLMEA